MPEIEHIVVLIMGELLVRQSARDDARTRFRWASQGVDGLTVAAGAFRTTTATLNGQKVFARTQFRRASSPGHPARPGTPATSPTTAASTTGSWRERPGGDGVLGQVRHPVTYSLVKHFPFGERFFCSTLCQTYPNRRFFFTGPPRGRSHQHHDVHHPGSERDDLGPGSTPTDRAGGSTTRISPAW